jgi:hypothetical protein
MIQKNIILLIALVFCLVPSLASGVNAISQNIYIDDYQITYTYDTTAVNPDERFTLDVTIKNTGNYRDNIKLTIDSTNPFDLSTDTWLIGNLSSDESKEKSFRVDVDQDANSGKYNLDFTLKDNEIDEDDSFEIDVSSDKPELIIGSVTSSPSIISPDDTNIRLDINLENTGGGDATFARAKLILPSGFKASGSYSDSVNLGTIALKQGKTATFYIDTNSDITQGIKKASIEITYKDGVDDRTDTLQFDIPVKGKPIFEVVEVKTDPSGLSTGDTGAKIRITIKNIGTEEAQETSLRVFENSDYPFSFSEKTNFIGNIKPGETGTAVFSVDVDKSGNANIYLLQIQTRTVNNNDVITSDKTVPITVIKKQSSISPVLIISLLVMIILIAAVIFLYRKKKKDHHDKTHPHVGSSHTSSHIDSSEYSLDSGDIYY